MNKKHWKAQAAILVAGLILAGSLGHAQDAAVNRANRGQKRIDLQRSKSALPNAQQVQGTQATHSLGAVRPPRSGELYETGKEAEYDAVLDEQIAAMYKLNQQYRRSPNRGEYWLRLGELYSEKARRLGVIESNTYEKNLAAFQAKKTRIRPKLDQRRSRDYNLKAVQLYEWFVNDFPKDGKVDQALYSLGFNNFELGNPTKGEGFYQELVRRFPNSEYVTESEFALGEYYFENDKYDRALENYVKVIRVKKARLNSFAMFKSSWCLYQLKRTPEALKMLERVVKLGKASQGPDSPGARKAVNKVRLVGEALSDYVPFYSEVGEPEKAFEDFMRVNDGDEVQSKKMLERLAYIYGDAGNRAASHFVFRQLISMNPTGEKAAEYQHQIVLTYANSDQKQFRAELETWLNLFGAQSEWAQANQANKKLVTDMLTLQETTTRNYVLQLHQTAQNSRAEYSQKLAAYGYSIYLKHFAETSKGPEMQFFRAELLFDMERYADAAAIYTFVAEKDPKGAYFEKSVTNAVLAYEKTLPTAQEIDAKRGDTITAMPLDPPVANFEKAALRFIQVFPKGAKTSDIQRRLGVLYYSYNHFDQAIAIFEQIIKADPKSQNAEIAGNLILDIYNLKKDMIGFAEKGQQLLQNEAFANTKFGQKIKSMMEKASYLRADRIAQNGDPAKAAKEFEGFATSYKQSDLAAAARFKAAENYTKAGDLVSAIRMHNLVLLAPISNPKIKAVQNDSRNALAKIYQDTGQLELAAQQFQDYAATNTKDAKAVNAFFNAGILFDALGDGKLAIQNYTNYYTYTKKRDRIETLFLEGEIYRRQKQFPRAERAYDDYLQAGPGSQSNAIQASFMIAKMAHDREQNAKAKQWYNRTLELFKGSSRAARENSVKYAAESKFQLSHETLKLLNAIRFGASTASQGAAAKDVEFLRKKYVAEMKDVIEFNYGPYIVAALASTGQMFDTIAGLYSRVPAPRGLNAEDSAKYKALIQQTVDKYRNDGKTSYKAAVDKSVEVETFTPWTKVAQDGLAATAQADGSQSPEIAADSRAADWMGL